MGSQISVFDPNINISFIDKLPWESFGVEESWSQMIVNSAGVFDIDLIKEIIIWDRNWLVKEYGEEEANYMIEDTPPPDEQVKANIYTVYLLCREKCVEFYRSHILSNILTNQNKAANRMINNIAAAMQDFFKVPIVDLIRRFRRCNEIGRQLTSIYTLMPNIEMISNEIERTITVMRTIDSDQKDKFLDAITTMLERRVPQV